MGWSGGRGKTGLLVGGLGQTSRLGDVVEVDELLVATGRRPALDAVGLGSVGLGPDDVLADRLPSWLHSVGDASGAAMLTHTGKHDARVLGSRLAAEAGMAPAETPEPQDVPVPQVVFTDPQVAVVGCTEAQARESGLDVVVAQVPYGSAAGSALLFGFVSAPEVAPRRWGRGQSGGRDEGPRRSARGTGRRRHSLSVRTGGATCAHDRQALPPAAVGTRACMECVVPWSGAGP